LTANQERTLIVNKLELTVSLVFALLLWNWRDLCSGMALMNASQTNSPISQLNVTYVPELSLSDDKSWSAWQAQVKRSNTTESYIKQPINYSQPSSSSESKTLDADQGHAVDVTPTETLLKGGSWANSIAIEDPNAKVLPESNTTTNDRPTSHENSDFIPNWLPNFWEPDSRRDPIQQPKTLFPLLSSTRNSPSNNPMTVISVPVTVVAPSDSITSNINFDTSLDLEDLVFSDRFPWGFLLLALVGEIGVVGMGYVLLKRGTRPSSAQRPKTNRGFA
jgi:hypothetical protein